MNTKDDSYCNQIITKFSLIKSSFFESENQFIEIYSLNEENIQNFLQSIFQVFGLQILKQNLQKQNINLNLLYSLISKILVHQEEILELIFDEGIKIEEQLKKDSSKEIGMNIKYQFLKQYQQFLTKFVQKYYFSFSNCKFHNQSSQTIQQFEQKELNQTKIQINQQKQRNVTFTIKEIIRNKFQLLTKTQDFQQKQRNVTFTIQEIIRNRFWLLTKTQDFKFSNILKHQDMTLSSNFKIAYFKSSGYVCLCDKPVLKNQIDRVDFKIKHSYICVGICLINYIKQGYLHQYQSNNAGYYMMYYDGCCDNHHSPSFSSGSRFSFTTGEIIGVEVNVLNKSVTWSNTRGQFFTQEIQTNSDIYFCFGNYSGGPGEMEIC